MLSYAFHVLIYSAIFFIVGMIKPSWPLFFLKKPSRFIIMSITLVLFMIGMTMYGEGLQQEKLLKQKKEQPAEQAAPTPQAELPTVSPEPAKAP